MTAVQPDLAQALKRLVFFLEPIWKDVLNQHLALCVGTRDQSRCSYSNLNLF